MYDMLIDSCGVRAQCLMYLSILHFYYILICFMYVCVKRTRCRSQFSPISWVQRTELRSD